MFALEQSQALPLPCGTKLVCPSVERLRTFLHSSPPAALGTSAAEEPERPCSGGPLRAHPSSGQDKGLLGDGLSARGDGRKLSGLIYFSYMVCSSSVVC